MIRLFLCFLLLIIVGFSLNNYDYFVNLLKITNGSNLTFYNLNKLSYDYYINLMFSRQNLSENYNLTEIVYDYYINLDNLKILKRYLISNLDYDYFVILNITGKLNLTVTNSTVIIITPNNEYLNVTNVYFNYLVNNYTGKCYAIVDGKIKNVAKIVDYKNVSFNLNLSSGHHSWFVVCGNKTSNITYFYVTIPEITIFSPDSLEPEGSVLFYIKVNTIENTTSYYELYNSNGNLIFNKSFHNIIYDYQDLGKGKYVLKVISKNNYSVVMKTLNFSVFTYSGDYQASVPEDQSYALFVLLLVLIYIINYKNKKGD